MPGYFRSRIPDISRALPRDLQRAETESAHAIKDIAKALCPRDEDGETHLQDAIHVETHRVENGREYTAVVAWSHEAWYGGLVEFGHHQKGGPGNTQVVGYVPARPFMVPAGEAGREIVRHRANEAIGHAARAGHA